MAFKGGKGKNGKIEKLSMRASTLCGIAIVTGSSRHALFGKTKSEAILN
jgi:hypothetical protein